MLKLKYKIGQFFLKLRGHNSYIEVLFRSYSFTNIFPAFPNPPLTELVDALSKSRWITLYDWDTRYLPSISIYWHRPATNLAVTWIRDMIRASSNHPLEKQCCNNIKYVYPSGGIIISIRHHCRPWGVRIK